MTHNVHSYKHEIDTYTVVDHTHADAVVTISNTADGEKRIREIFGDDVLVIPYVMPGFLLAKKVFEMTQGLDWGKCKGMILMNHGVFTFDDDARVSYEKMIELVSMAENYLSKQESKATATSPIPEENLLKLAQIRKVVSNTRNSALLAVPNQSLANMAFSHLPNVADLVSRGPLTPDHIIRTKQVPVVISDDPDQDVLHFTEAYETYFLRNKSENMQMLNPAPKWAVWPKHGTISFGASLKEAAIISDITEHTLNAIQRAESLDRWVALPEKDLFEVEYWELEQAKLKKKAGAKEFQGQIALVTGAASGIGKACVETLHQNGATIIALDVSQDMEGLFGDVNILEIVCDVTDQAAMKLAVEAGVRAFGGLDIIVSNAGIFSAGKHLEKMDDNMWSTSLSVNLTSHQQLLSICIPFLKEGINPAVVFIGSKNVPAPGPGASAYSVAKAGLAQLARVAALELGPAGIRVNTIHPNAIYDTAIWTDEVLNSRAAHYGLTVDQYKTNNLIKTELFSTDVAGMVCAMAGKTFSKTTGAQVPVDGGNERVV